MVCKDCGAERVKILKINEKHRQCQICTIEVNQFNKIITKVLKFVKNIKEKLNFAVESSISKRWIGCLPSKFRLMSDQIQINYQNAKKRLPQSEDEKSMVTQDMRTFANIYQPERANYNYSWFDMIFLVTEKIDQKVQQQIVQRVLQTFFNNNPNVGLAKDMIHIIYFLLIYCSEETTFYLFSLIYQFVVPTYLYPNEYKKNSNLIDKDIDHILEILRNVHKIENFYQIANYKEFLNKNYLTMVQGCLANTLSWESYFVLIDTIFSEFDINPLENCIGLMCKQSQLQFEQQYNQTLIYKQMIKNTNPVRVREFLYQQIQNSKQNTSQRNVRKKIEQIEENQQIKTFDENELQVESEKQNQIEIQTLTEYRNELTIESMQITNDLDVQSEQSLDDKNQNCGEYQKNCGEKYENQNIQKFEDTNNKNDIQVKKECILPDLNLDTSNLQQLIQNYDDHQKDFASNSQNIKQTLNDQNIDEKKNFFNFVMNLTHDYQLQPICQQNKDLQQIFEQILIQSNKYNQVIFEKLPDQIQNNDNDNLKQIFQQNLLLNEQNSQNLIMIQEINKKLEEKEDQLQKIKYELNQIHEQMKIEITGYNQIIDDQNLDIIKLNDENNKLQITVSEKLIFSELNQKLQKKVFQQQIFEYQEIIEFKQKQISSMDEIIKANILNERTNNLKIEQINQENQIVQNQLEQTLIKYEQIIKNNRDYMEQIDNLQITISLLNNQIYEHKIENNLYQIQINQQELIMTGQNGHSKVNNKISSSIKNQILNDQNYKNGCDEQNQKQNETFKLKEDIVYQKQQNLLLSDHIDNQSNILKINSQFMKNMIILQEQQSDLLIKLQSDLQELLIKKMF